MKKLAVYFVLCLLLGSLAATPANADRLECVWGDYYFTVKRDDSEYTASIIG